MRIYIYIFEDDGISVKSHKVIETEKTYRSASGECFGDGVYLKTIYKDFIGIVSERTFEKFVVLEQRDDERARKVFLEYFKSEISELESKIKKIEKKVDLCNAEVRYVG